MFGTVLFLLPAVTTDVPIQVTIHKVKKIDKDNYKKRQSWQLTDLKFVDGKNAKVVRVASLHSTSPSKELFNHFFFWYVV